MATADMKMRLSERYLLTKEDVELIYGEAVRVVGGTYYASGVITGPANGLLDQRNFKFDAGIEVVNRAEPNSLFAVQIPLRRYTSTAAVTQHVALPAPLIGLEQEFSATVIAWTLGVAETSNAVNAGSAQLHYLRDGVYTQIGTTATLTNVATLSAPVDQGSLSVALKPLDRLRLTFQITTASITMSGIVCTVMLKSRHSR